MSHQQVRYFLVGLLAFGGLTALTALAADITVTGTVETTQNNQGLGNVTVAASGIISTNGPQILGIVASGDDITITNAGTISTRGSFSWGINTSSGNRTTIINTGSISTTGQFSYGIYATGADTTITNSGSISSSQYDGEGIFATGANATITNSGSISTTGSSSAGIYATGANATITNSGSISTTGQYSFGIDARGSGTTITNTGSISTAGEFGNGIDLRGNGITITNTGSISTTGSNNSGIYATGANATITNTGSITVGMSSYGISAASGAINTLNNAQGGDGTSPSTRALTYTSNLPTNYNIIINSANHYGQLTVTNGIGTTTFGISSLTTTSRSIINATFASVLTGISATQLGLSGLTSFSGVTGIYSYILTLTDPALNIWGLTITACQVCKINIVSGETVTLSQLSGEPNFIMAGGALALSNGDQSSQNFSVESTSTVTAPTTGSATLSGVFSGSGGLIFNGVGTTILTGANTYSGGTTVSSGVLQGNTTSLQGSIVNNSQVVFDQATQGTYSGVMSGTGSLVKQNTGTLILTGANTYTGGTTVTSGTLSVSGSSPTGFGNVLVSSGATLMGTGTINGQLTVAGILKPGNSPGFLAATSTVTMNAGSTYVQDIAGSAQATSATPVGATGYYSALNITGGQFVINSGSTLTPRLSNLFTSSESGYGSTPYTPVLGDRFRMVRADGGISGKFSAITQPAELAAGTQFLPFYNMAGSNSVDLAVIPTSYKTTITSLSGNKNAQSVGGVLDTIVAAAQTGTSTIAQDQLLYATYNQTLTSLASFTQSLAGEVYAAAVAVIAQSSQRVQQAVMSRLGDTMGSSLPNSLSNPVGNTALMAVSNTALSGGVASSAVSTNPAVNPNTEVRAFSNGNVWGDLAYQKGNRSSDSYSGGWNTNLYQLVFGSDYYVSEGLRVGGGIALSSTTLNPTYGSGTIQQGSIFAYGKKSLDVYVVDAMASFGLNSSDLSRGDVTSLSSGFRNKTISGNDAMVGLGLSRPIDLDNFRITPYARVTWQMVTQSSVNEGGAASALSVNGFTGNGVRGVLGIAAGSKATDPMNEKYTYRAYVGVGTDSSGLLNPTLNASLAGVSTNITTPNAGSTFVQAGVYGTAKVSDNAYAFAGFSGEARSSQTLGAVNIGLRVQF